MWVKQPLDLFEVYMHQFTWIFLSSLLLLFEIYAIFFRTQGLRMSHSGFNAPLSCFFSALIIGL